MLLKKNASRDIALCAVMTSLAIVFGYVEHLIPFPVGVYGLKLGLANLVVVVMLYKFDAKTAFSINLVRILLCSILFGSVISMIYSLFGGILSFLVMLLVKKTNKFSVIGVSICGGITHNIAQICAAALLLSEIRIAFYLPVLIIVGALTGTLIGVIANLLIKHPIFDKKI